MLEVIIATLIVTIAAVAGKNPTKPVETKYCESAVIMEHTVSRCLNYGVTKDSGYQVKKEN